jgi:alanine-glyoxylate transaminase / serine-glyoxylate transaminase / serine-pyruvate transaminase
MLRDNPAGFFPYTPATNLLFGLEEALRMLNEEGLAQVFARHARHAEATRRAVRAWGLETVCQDPREHSNTLTAVLLPAGQDADHVRKIILERYDLSLGTGLGKFKGQIFRIGHLGDLNDLTLVGALGGVEMGLVSAGIPFQRGGVLAALEYLTTN